MFTELPVPTSSFVMATLSNHVYAFGGSGECKDSTPVYMFDGYNRTSMASIAGLPYLAHAGVAIDSDHVLICGGWAWMNTSCAPVSDCFIYSAVHKEWTQVASKALEQYFHSMIMFEGDNTIKHNLSRCRADIHIR